MGKASKKDAVETPGVDYLKMGLGLLVIVLLGSNLVAWTRNVNVARTAPVVPTTGETRLASEPPARTRQPTNKHRIVNGHDHLYKIEHLEKYMKAAARMGVEKTLFVASSEFTFLGKGSMEKLNDWSTKEILQAAALYPGKIIPFATLHPNDENKTELLQSYLDQGIVGLKLYTGHGNFYDRPLDDPSMLPVYAFAVEHDMPILWHVNMRRYTEDLAKVLLKFPDLKVLIPHFGVGFWEPDGGVMDALGTMMDTYPNVYVDTSFGTREILVGGLAKVTAYNGLFRDYYHKYQDRLIFGTDMVVTGNSEKTEDWVESVIRACRDVHEQDEYTFWMAAKGCKYAYRDANPEGRLRGLALSDDILEKIYWKNIHTFLNLKE